MAGHEQSAVQTALHNDQRPFEPLSEPPAPSDLLIKTRPEVEPESLTPITTTVEVVLSDTAGLHTALEEVIITTPLPQQGLAAPPPPLAPHAANPAHLNHRVRPSAHSPGMSTVMNLAPAAEPLISISLPPTSTHIVPTGTLEVTLGKQPHTLITMTRPHNISFALPTKIVHVNPHWPQVGTIVAESDIPAPWRETYEMKEQKQQYGALGAICGVFVLGVLGVLALGWWK